MKTENEKIVESYRDWIEPIDISPDRDEIERAWVAMLDARDALTDYPEAHGLTQEQADAEMEAEDAAKAHLVRVVRESEATWPGIQDFVRQFVVLAKRVAPSNGAGVNLFISRQVSLTAVLLGDLLAENSPERRALSEATLAMCEVLDGMSTK